VKIFKGREGVKNIQLALKHLKDTHFLKRNPQNKLFCPGKAGWWVAKDSYGIRLTIVI